MTKKHELLVVLCAILTQGVFGMAAPDVEVDSETGRVRSLISGRPLGEIAIAGRLYTELHAKFMAARSYGTETVLNWYNLGYSGGGADSAMRVGGTFGNFGLDVHWSERDETYPVWSPTEETPAIYFDGSRFMKSNYPAEQDITGQNQVTVEVWVINENPTEDEVILGWQTADGFESSAPFYWPEGLEGSGAWRHIVVSASGEQDTLYVDGVEVVSRPREMVIGEGHRMILGGASEHQPTFSGHLAVVRVHKSALSAQQVTHNFAGGIMLGAILHANIDPHIQPDQGYIYDTWSDADPDNYFTQESERFRFRINLDRLETMSARQREEFYEVRIPAMFERAELTFENYSERHALRMPIVSRHHHFRGDGVKYKTNIHPTDGAAWMGWNNSVGFGYPGQGPGHLNPHELVHVVQSQTGGRMQGNYWEVHANFPQTYLGIYQSVPVFLELRDSMLFEASGRSHYHARLMMQHLAETEQYGPMFISKLWYDGIGNEYPWITFERYNPDRETSLGYEWARMAQKAITMEDFTVHGDSPNLYTDEMSNNLETILRTAYVFLEEISYEPGWYRAPKQWAPQQTGWSIIPLTVLDDEVTVELSGYINPERGSRWYAGFVAIDNDGVSRYGDIFSTGDTSEFQLKDNEEELYLAIAAIPDNIMTINFTGDVRSPEQEQFVYKLRFEGAEPHNVLIEHYNRSHSFTPFIEHPNGGGSVARTSIVEETAYVGPNARVVGVSRVTGNARIEDYAIVDSSEVSGNAIVSGHALLRNAVVTGYARVRDYARVNNNATVTDYAKVVEHATLSGGINRGTVTTKGQAWQQGNASGTAMIDGHYTKRNEVDKGKWFSWSWGTGQNPGEIDAEFHGLYMKMTFENDHPWMAWDDFGLTWGYLVNAPRIIEDPDRGNVLSLNGQDQFVELAPDVADQIFLTMVLEVKWAGGDNNQVIFDFGNAAENTLYLTPSNEDGKIALVLNHETAQHQIVGSEPLPVDEWVTIMIVLDEETGGHFYLDSQLVGQNPELKIRPLTIGAGKFTNYLGRSQRGDSYFYGKVDSIQVYNRALSTDFFESRSKSTLE